MYIRQQTESAGNSLGFGWLEDFAASSNEAEARRLKDEMRKLASGNMDRKEAGSNMKGVEHYYQTWLKLNAGVDWEVYQLAAEAARGLGCGAVRYLRLMKALGANPPQKAAQDITAVKQNMERCWAHVDIRLRRKARGDLQAERGLPFAPDERTAILRAQKELNERGKFDGLLPAIPYTIDGHDVPLGPDFAISSGMSVVNIDQKGDGSFQTRSKLGPWDYSRVSDECR